jgi:hypothetical protein
MTREFPTQAGKHHSMLMVEREVDARSLAGLNTVQAWVG